MNVWRVTDSDGDVWFHLANEDFTNQDEVYASFGKNIELEAGVWVAQSLSNTQPSLRVNDDA